MINFHWKIEECHCWFLANTQHLDYLTNNMNYNLFFWKWKTTSVNKHVNDHNITGITQVSIRDRFRPYSRGSSGGWTKTATGINEKIKLSNATTENRDCKSTLCIGTTPSECSLSKEHMAYVLSYGLCSFDKEHSLGLMPMHNVNLQSLLSVVALLNLVFSLMPVAFFVLPPDESHKQGRNRSRMLTCVIPVMLWSLTCLLTDVVFFLSLDRYGSPPGGVISVVPLLFPWWFYVIISLYL